MRRCGNSRRKGHDVEAKEFGRFIAGMRKEKKMTQAELAEKIHVTDKAVSRWERGGVHLDKDTTSIPRGLLLNRYSRRAG